MTNRYELAGRISNDIALIYKEMFIQKTRLIDPKCMNDLPFRLKLHREICDYIAEYYYK